MTKNPPTKSVRRRLRDRLRARLMRERAGQVVSIIYNGTTVIRSKKPPLPGAWWCDGCGDWHTPLRR